MSSVAKRRINGNPTPSNNPYQYSPIESPPSPQSAGLTLPQVIALVDKRLIHLETNMATKTDVPPNDEIENRFEILAEEISNIKEIVLKLQSYTMSVNKMLLDEKTTSKEEFHMDL